MEKQRISIRRKPCRRFLISLLLLFTSIQLFSQTLTLDQVRQLRIRPEENQNLYTKADIKFTVTIPVVRPSQIQVLSTDQKNDINFRTMRKAENYDDKGTILELWYSFDKKGEYNLSPISVVIQGRNRSIAFEKISVTEDPARMNPRIVLVFDNGTKVFSDGGDEGTFPSPLMTVPEGKKVRFTVNLQYATQLVKFNWDIPQNSIFTQTEEYEFTEVKYRERVYSHDLIPVAAFEWTGLKAGTEQLPKFRMTATGYNGTRNELIFPNLNVVFTADTKEEETVAEADIFSEAFQAEPVQQESLAVSELSSSDCERLAALYSKERNAFFTYFSTKNERMTFEESCGLSAEHTQMFSSILIYISILLILLCIPGIIISKIKKHKVRLLIFISVLIFAAAVLSYSCIKRGENYAICKGCKIYSVPETSAAASSEISAGNLVRISEKTGNWVYIELGETGGWCTTENICIIK